MTPPDLTPILDLYRQRAGDRYGGESVSQLEHALQSAALAAAASAPPSLIAASLLHDIGHLLVSESVSETAGEGDARHEDIGARYLERYFGPAVTEPIRLHVAAKRYLCAVDPRYGASLSAASQHSLRPQGGPLAPEAAAQFLAQPYARKAVQLRRWDEQAKVPNLPVPTLEDWLPVLRTCAIASGSRKSDLDRT